MSQPYKLYGRPNAGSLAPQIILEEVGAKYELIWVGREAADVEALRRVNPAGKVPALVLPDGTPIFESAAILIHLTNVYRDESLAPPVGTSAHARFLQWMVYVSSNVYESALRWYYPDRYGTPGSDVAPAIKQQALVEHERQLALIHERLAPYVLGETWSAVDPYLHMLVGWHPDVSGLYARLPKLARHAELQRERPATQVAERAHAAT